MLGVRSISTPAFFKARYRDDVRHVDEVVLFRVVAEKVADVILNFMQRNDVFAPSADIGFVRDAKIST
jgi:hypothetical protein